MKVLKKSMVEKKKQQNHVKDEREIMQKISNPFIVKLHYAF